MVWSDWKQSAIIGNFIVNLFEYAGTSYRATTPKQKDEISLNGKVKIVVDGKISRELANSFALNDYRVTASKARA